MPGGGGDKKEDRQTSLLKAIDDDDAWNAMIVSLQYSDEQIPIWRDNGILR